ncbi:exosome complex exonuclease RRP42, putative [Entamoeba invadens IP1]|uniref:Ribosomal RNA-processing protein 42 n=1 Tax=Entamoeba invadens IP1 TaxID=370355 RepID=A0A0A1U0S2_ENTIV|nr:exosome complex exonuclease RRP42, putative [Entamoeba invadens IP1]ELP86133.1 exosome complex exonuclease RRP42, putative [Entamoeba invadens IP1]|eukprot:XP_004185479.1 exosome complex exonuclease RRP42, putative [Entamoeba invadens IP1]
MYALSTSEVEFIKEGVSVNVRTDGRSVLQFREFRCERDVIDQANGSVRFFLGRTEVVVGIKCELEEPQATSSNEGRYTVLVRKSGADNVRDVSIEQMITVSLENAGKEMLKKLCVSPGKLCWVVYVDAIVVEDDGNVMDCVSLAVRAALLSTLIPVVTVISGDAEEVQIDINKDNVQFIHFEPSALPVCVSLVLLDEVYVVDPSHTEEMCSGGVLTTAVTESGLVCGIQKGGVGSFKVNVLYDMVMQAQTIGLKVIHDLDDILID